MAWTPRAQDPIQLTGSAATLYTAPSAGTTLTGLARIRKIHFDNTDTAAHTVTVSNGANAAATQWLSAFSIPANSPYDLWGPFYVKAGVTIQGLADTTLKVTAQIDVDEQTFSS